MKGLEALGLRVYFFPPQFSVRRNRSVVKKACAKREGQEAGKTVAAGH